MNPSNKHTEETLRLEKIIGLSTINNSSISVCPCSGHIAYIAGCILTHHS